MSNEPITEEQLLFIETWHTPKAMLEILFHNWDNLNSFNTKKVGELRLYQESMLSDEAIIDFELTAELEELDRQEIFNYRKNVGDIYCFGARKFGKSLVTMIMDTIVQMLTNPADKVVLGSVDLIHLRQILDPIKNCFEAHPICRMWKKRITGAPDFKIELKNDWVLNSVNFNIGSRSPGQQFYGKHTYRLLVEEASLETEEVYEKRKDALSEMGAIFRISGMTNFTPHSPAGKAFYDPKLKKQVLNYPQMVNSTFNLDKQKKAEEDYGGKGSIGYRVFVEGEIVEDGICIAEGSRILKSDFSQVAIENINVGDELLAFSENIPRTIIRTKVLSKHNNGTKEVIGIKTGNNELWLTPTHKVVAMSRRSYRWIDIDTCLKRNYPILSFNNIIKNEISYYWGVLLGIIDSDGTRLYDKSGSGKYSIYITQSLNCEWKMVK